MVAPVYRWIEPLLAPAWDWTLDPMPPSIQASNLVTVPLSLVLPLSLVMSLVTPLLSVRVRAWSSTGHADLTWTSVSGGQLRVTASGLRPYTLSCIRLSEAWVLQQELPCEGLILMRPPCILPNTCLITNCNGDYWPKYSTSCSCLTILNNSGLP